MRNLTSPVWIKLEGALFLLLGLLSGALIVLQRPTLRDGVLLIITIWAFCRFYYFAFYGMEHDVDFRFRFTGLGSIARYLVREEPSTDDAS